MVTAYTGINSWAGGSVESNVGNPHHIPNATLTIDDEVIVKDGKLTVKDD